jgi:hypothetical protein
MYNKITFITNIWLFIVTLLAANSAYSWGSLGHQVVCDLAWRASAPATQRQLAAAAKRMGYTTFAESCTWADKIKSQSRYDALKPLHYMNLDRHNSHVSSAACIETHPPQCVLPAIVYYARVMKNPSLGQKERDKALLLLGHFVADIHQPLHVSYKEDRGGTRQKVIFNGKPTNLHRLWDSQLLYCQPVEGKRPTWRRLGTVLFNRLVPSVDNVERPITAWAQESFDITKNIYQDIAENNNSRSLTDDYCERHYSVALSRLQLAGQRLATLLTD